MLVFSEKMFLLSLIAAATDLAPAFKPPFLCHRTQRFSVTEFEARNNGLAIIDSPIAAESTFFRISIMHHKTIGSPIQQSQWWDGKDRDVCYLIPMEQLQPPIYVSGEDIITLGNERIPGTPEDKTIIYLSKTRLEEEKRRLGINRKMSELYTHLEVRACNFNLSTDQEELKKLIEERCKAVNRPYIYPKDPEQLSAKDHFKTFEMIMDDDLRLKQFRINNIEVTFQQLFAQNPATFFTKSKEYASKLPSLPSNEEIYVIKYPNGTQEELTESELLARYFPSKPKTLDAHTVFGRYNINMLTVPMVFLAHHREVLIDKGIAINHIFKNIKYRDDGSIEEGAFNEAFIRQCRDDFEAIRAESQSYLESASDSQRISFEQWVSYQKINLEVIEKINLRDTNQIIRLISSLLEISEHVTEQTAQVIDIFIVELARIDKTKFSNDAWEKAILPLIYGGLLTCEEYNQIPPHKQNELFAHILRAFRS